jgi:hypothetical protein
MEERFLVRIDEEYPSDKRLEVQFVEAEMGGEYKKRLDALVEKLDSLSMEPNAEVLEEIKDILSDLHTAVKVIDNKYYNVADALNRIEGKQAPDTEKLSESMEGLRLALERKYFDMEDSIQGVGQSMKTSLESTNTAMDKKFYEINDNIQDIKDKINKRDDSEVKDMLLAISDKMDSQQGSAMDELKLEEVKNMVADLTIHVENLAQKYEAVSQNIVEKQSDDDIMDRHIVSELEIIRNAIAQPALSDEVAKDLAGKLDSVKKSVTGAVNRSVRSQQKVDKTVKEFNAYLVRLNSIDYMLKLLNARSLLKTKRRLPKWAREKKTLLDKLILGLEEEVADILIVNVVPKAGMTLPELSKSIGRSRKNTMDRIAQLIAGGFVEERKIGRKRLYFLVG